MDKDHEREILERDRSRLKPEILHPLDLQSGGVEVVTITPKSQTHALYEKNQKAPVVKSKSIMKKLEESSKDSGHETSSIHTENSENESSDSSATSGGQVSSIFFYFFLSCILILVLPCSILSKLINRNSVNNPTLITRYDGFVVR